MSPVANTRSGFRPRSRNVCTEATSARRTTSESYESPPRRWKSDTCNQLTFMGYALWTASRLRTDRGCQELDPAACGKCETRIRPFSLRTAGPCRRACRPGVGRGCGVCGGFCDFDPPVLDCDLAEEGSAL